MDAVPRMPRRRTARSMIRIVAVLFVIAASFFIVSAATELPFSSSSPQPPHHGSALFDRSAETLERVHGGLVPRHALILRDASLAPPSPPHTLTGQGVWGRCAEETAPAFVGPHPTLSPTSAIPPGRFMVLVRPSDWTPASGCTGRPPLTCVSETLEETLAEHGITDTHYLDESHLIAYVPRVLLRESARYDRDATRSLDTLAAEQCDEANGSPAAVTIAAVDVFAPGLGGQQLKLSHDLRRLIDDGASDLPPTGPAFLDSAFTSAVNGDRTLRVTVWPLRGAAAALKRELDSTALRRQQRGQALAGRSEQTLRTTCAVEDQPLGCPGTCPDHLLLVLTVPAEATFGAALHAEVSAVLLRVASHPWVRWVEPLSSGALPANDKAAGLIQSNVALVHPLPAAFGSPEWLTAHPLWTAGINGSGEIVAIVDSGVDVDSCFFHDANSPDIAYYPQTNHNHRKVLSYLRARCDGDPAGDAADLASGHGTHVAGSAVGHVQGHATMSAYNGVATGARLFVHDLGCPESPKLQLPSNFRDVFTPSYDVGARISCNSWGVDSQPTYSAMERMVDQYLYDHDDMLGIFAAGNVPRLGPTRPGRTKNVLTVGSHRNANGRLQDDISGFSAHGPTYDRRQKPDVVAPGESIQSAYSDGRTNSPQCAVTRKQGTSMSAAIVAGGAALVRQYLRERRAIPSPSAALVKAAIIHATHFLSATPARSGFGRVDLSLLLRTEATPTWDANGMAPSDGGETGAWVHDSDSPPPHPPYRLWLRDRQPIAHFESHAFWFSAASTASESTDETTLPSQQDETQRTQPGAGRRDAEAATIKVTLVWTDVGSAAEGSTRSLVHDLDLTVVDRRGQLYYSHSRARPRERYFDRDNNVEQIELALTPELSQGFRVFVYGAAVLTRATQAYALMVTAPGLVFYDSHLSLLEAQAQTQAHNRTTTPVLCPGNCTDSRGQCNSLTAQCECLRVYQFIDCSQCNARVLCGGQSTCDDASLKCTCDPHGHFDDTSDCRSCQAGWFGEDCRFDCSCEHGGKCDESRGVCQCPHDGRLGGAGCYQGPHCEYCCDGFGGERCNEVSYWCDESGALVEITDNDGALIQVNGLERYQTSVTCRWRIRAPPGHFVALEVLKMDVETGFDFLNVYDTLNAAKADDGFLIQRYTGSAAAPTGVSSSSSVMDLVFVSDWEGTASGFQLRYRFVPVTQPSTCHVQCDGGPPGEGLPDVAAQEHRTCGIDLGLDEQCVCQQGFMGFHCEHLVNRTITATTATPPTTALVSPALVPTDHDVVAQSSLQLDGLIPAGTPLFGNQLLSLAAPRLSVRLPLSVNAPSRLDLTVTLVGEWASHSVSLYEQQVRVQLRFEPLSMCDPAGHSGQPRSVRASTSALSNLFGLSLAASVHDRGLSVPERSTQVLSLYHCDSTAVHPSIAVVLRSPDLQAVGDSGRVQLTFKAQISLMVMWNATATVPAGVLRPPQVIDVAVVPTSAHWLGRSVRGTSPEVNTAHVLLLPWSCDDGSTAPLATVAGQLVERLDESEQPPVAQEKRPTSIGQLVVTSCFGLLCGAVLALFVGYPLRCLTRRRTAQYGIRQTGATEELGLFPSAPGVAQGKTVVYA